MEGKQSREGGLQGKFVWVSVSSRGLGMGSEDQLLEAE